MVQKTTRLSIFYNEKPVCFSAVSANIMFILRNCLNFYQKSALAAKISSIELLLDFNLDDAGEGIAAVVAQI